MQEQNLLILMPFLENAEQTTQLILEKSGKSLEEIQELVRKKKEKKLKVRIIPNDNISEEESNRIWFKLFDMLLAKDNKHEGDKGRKKS